MIALFFGCQLNTQALVLGKDIPAQRIDGSIGSGFGSALAAGVDGFLVSAPTDNQLQYFDWNGDILGEWAVVLDQNSRLFLIDHVPFVQTEKSLFRLSDDGLVDVFLEDITAANYCHGEWFWSHEQDVVDIQCDTEGIVEKRCLENGCAIEINGQSVPLSLDGDYRLTSKGWCWGMVDFEDSQDGGQLICVDGTSIEGHGGERLGLRLTSNWGSGTMGRQLRPPRGHIVSLEGGISLVVEGGSDALPYALAEVEDWLVIGVPTAQRHDVLGAVWLVSLSSI